MIQLRARNYVLAPVHFDHVINCPASRVYTAKRSPPSFANWYGIAVHLFLEKAMKHGRDAALVYIAKKFPSKLEACKRIDFRAIPKGDPEVQFLLDTERRTSYRGTWDDADPEQHIAARADLVVDASEVMVPVQLAAHDTDHWIIDYKTGKTALDLSPDTFQTRTLACARWQELDRPNYGVGAAIAAIPTSGKVLWSHAVFQPSALRAVENALRKIHLEVLETRAERRDGIEPEFKVGPWCDRCSAWAVCETRKAADVVVHVKGSS